MFEVDLFLGFPISDDFRSRLNGVNPHLFDRFVNEGSEYLREVEHDGIKYLGKFVGGILETGRSELLETNIFSMIKRLVPDFSYDDTSLVLLATNE